MEFLFFCSTQCDLTHSLHSLVRLLWSIMRYRIEHSKRNFLCPHALGALFSIYLLISSSMNLFSVTRPHSVGLALNDSPAGLAAYILEKFAMWSGCKTTDTAMCLESSFSKDDLLTNVMIYWATHSITSSIRLYYEDMHSPNVQIVGRLV